MTTATIKRTIAQVIKEKVGTNVMACYQCKKCTTGCPLVDEMDFKPNEIMRLLQFDRAEKALNSKTIWMCASCKTCTTRCPNDIDITGVMDYLKSTALETGKAPSVPEIATFINVATRNIKWFGRMYEVGLAGELNLRAGQPFRDMSLAKRLISSGKLSLLPEFGKHSRSAGTSTRPDAVTVSYYPGCSAHGTAKEYDMSARVIADKLNLVFDEPKGWTCCGTTAAEWKSPTLSKEMSTKNLKLVEKQGRSAVTTPCPACYYHLRHGSALAGKDGGHDSQGPAIEVDHLIDTLLERVGVDKIKAGVTKSLKGLKAVCYYGCLMTRPPKLTGADNPEYPMSIDKVVRALGAQTLDWSYKTECCGASHAISRTQSALPLMQRILQNAKEVGAEMVIVACPMCQSNLDTRQEAIKDDNGVAYNIPIVYFTQLLGIAMGAGEKELGLDKLFIDPRPLLKEKGFLG